MTKLQVFIVMGISWILEVVYVYNQHQTKLKFMIELYNILRGIMVFLIFVWKRPVAHELKRRFGLSSIDSILFCICECELKAYGMH